MLDLYSGPLVKDLPANVVDTGLIPCLGSLHMPYFNWATTKSSPLLTATRNSPYPPVKTQHNQR